MTKQEIIYDIRERLNLHSDDLTITNEYLSYTIDKYRAVFLKNKYSKLSRKIPNVNKQRIELTMTPLQVGSYVGSVLKSSESIPSLLNSEVLDNLVMLSNGSLEAFPMNYVSMERFNYSAIEDPFTRNYIFGTIKEDNKLYLKSWDNTISLMENAYLWGTFRTPEDAWLLSPDYSAALDFNIDEEYPLEDELVADIIRTLVKDLLIQYDVPTDDKNNANDDTEKKAQN